MSVLKFRSGITFCQIWELTLTLMQRYTFPSLGVEGGHMPYTLQQLVKLSGVSVSTHHDYDEVDFRSVRVADGQQIME